MKIVFCKLIYFINNQIKILHLSKTEIWEVGDFTYDGRLVSPELENVFTPATFLVDSDFCT